jgi:hypothetical protein
MADSILCADVLTLRRDRPMGFGDVCATRGTAEVDARHAASNATLSEDVGHLQSGPLHAAGGV